MTRHPFSKNKAKNNTNLSKLIALAACLSIAAVVGSSVLTPSAPIVQAHTYTNENRVAAISSQNVVKTSTQNTEHPAENQ